MKTLLLLLGSMIPLSAMAGVNLTRTTTNGTVAPAFSQVHICTIAGRGVTTETRGPQIRFPHELIKQAMYTTEVPNETVMENLASEVAQGQLANFPGPIGGGVQTDAVTIDTTTSTILRKTGSSVLTSNNSPASAKLESFISKNCK